MLCYDLSLNYKDCFEIIYKKNSVHSSTRQVRDQALELTLSLTSLVLIKFRGHGEIPGDGVATGCAPPGGPELVMAGPYSVSGVELDVVQGN